MTLSFSALVLALVVSHVEGSAANDLLQSGTSLYSTPPQCSVTSIKVTPVIDSLTFIAQVEAKHADVRFTWRRSDGVGPTVFLDHLVEGRHTFELKRLGLRREYDVDAFCMNASDPVLLHSWSKLVAGRQLVLPQGVTARVLHEGVGLDSSNWATITGTPTWEMLATDQAGYLTVFDTTGDVVWYTSNCGGPKEVDTDGSIVCMTSDGMQDVAYMRELTSDGTISQSAPGSGYNHEARIDSFANASVLTFEDNTENGVKGQDLLAWDRDSNTMSTVFSLFDYFDPNTDWGAMSSSSDWTHANAAGTGSSNNYVIGIRHLSAIASFDHDTLEKEWVLSSEITSDFTFDSDNSHFYNMHDAQQISDGTIIAFDNGDSRPDSEGGAYSRGVQYELDFDSMTATLIWEYVTGEYSTHAGAITKMDNGNFVVAASCDTNSLSNCNMEVFEVDEDGNLISTALTPENGSMGSYRTEPWTTIGGESILVQ